MKNRRRKHGGAKRSVSTRIEEAIVEMVFDVNKHLLEEKENETRYLNQNKRLNTSVGLVAVKITELVALGLPEIRIGGRVRYDKKALDEFMAKYQI